MRVLNYSPGADLGGQGIAIKRAFDKHSDIEYRAVKRKSNYLGYPSDVPWTRRRQALKDADVIHVNDSFQGLDGVDKPMLVHYHGSKFRRNPEPALEIQRERGVPGLVATLDLWLISPDELEWVPFAHDLDWLATFRKPQDGPLRVGHAPTRRSVKSTEAFLAAADRIPNIEVVLIERQPWEKCLAVKGTVDVLYDQVALVYGNNSVEAWAMGIPVIAGAQPDTLAEMRNRFGALPFYEATENTIYEALREMVDGAARAEYAKRGLAHAQRFHDEKLVVRQLEATYRKAKAT